MVEHHVKPKPTKPYVPTQDPPAEA
ncbi:uncharacterized protein G2W53_022075 [Senna tora]|uniref:Uncharacterized protein n=1 Tax=Senna tora TaxID=362788 RepID=A0A834TN20_9FABA|nr:uncharacterized protein G2W53_022075 [Senna tora]